MASCEVEKYNNYIHKYYSDKIDELGIEINDKKIEPEAKVDNEENIYLKNNKHKYIEFEFKKPFQNGTTIFSDLLNYTTNDNNIKPYNIKYYIFINLEVKVVGIWVPAFLSFYYNYQTNDVLYNFGSVVNPYDILNKSLCNNFNEYNKEINMMVEYFNNNIKHKYSVYKYFSRESIFKSNNNDIIDLKIGKDFINTNFQINGKLDYLKIELKKNGKNNVNINSKNINISFNKIDDNNILFQINHNDKYFMIYKISSKIGSKTNMTISDFMHYTKEFVILTETITTEPNECIGHENGFEFNTISSLPALLYNCFKFMKNESTFINNNLKNVLFGGDYLQSIDINYDDQEIYYNMIKCFEKEPVITSLLYRGNLVISQYGNNTSCTKIVIDTNITTSQHPPTKMILTNNNKKELEITINTAGNMLVKTDNKQKYLKDNCLIGYKFASILSLGYDCVVKLKIPLTSRTATYTYHKYRTEKCIVDDIFIPQTDNCKKCKLLGINRKTIYYDENKKEFLCSEHVNDFILLPAVHLNYSFSSYDKKFVYYNDQQLIEPLGELINEDCGRGIHFCINYNDLFSHIGHPNIYDESILEKISKDNINKIIEFNKIVDIKKEESKDDDIGYIDSKLTFDIENNSIDVPSEITEFIKKEQHIFYKNTPSMFNFIFGKDKNE
jgi:hypothetical protein